MTDAMIVIERAYHATPELGDAFGQLRPMLSTSARAPFLRELDDSCRTQYLLVARDRSSASRIVRSLTLVVVRIPTGLRAWIEDVAGGGFAGVETIAVMNDCLREAVQFFPHLREDLLRIMLVSSGPGILPELGEKLGTYAQRKLAEQKMEIRLNCKVTAVKDQSITHQ